MKNVIHHCAVSIAAMCCVAGLDAATGVDYLQTEGVPVEKSFPYEIRVLDGTLRLQPGDGDGTRPPPGEQRPVPARAARSMP